MIRQVVTCHPDAGARSFYDVGLSRASGGGGPPDRQAGRSGLSAMALLLALQEIPAAAQLRAVHAVLQATQPVTAEDLRRGGQHAQARDMTTSPAWCGTLGRGVATSTERLRLRSFAWGLRQQELWAVRIDRGLVDTTTIIARGRPGLGMRPQQPRRARRRHHQPSSVPVKVKGLGPSARVVFLVAAFANSGALLADGKYLDWGTNGRGSRGRGVRRVRQVTQGGSVPGNGQTWRPSPTATCTWGMTGRAARGGKTAVQSSPRTSTPPSGVTYQTCDERGTSYGISPTLKLKLR